MTRSVFKAHMSISPAGQDELLVNDSLQRPISLRSVPREESEHILTGDMRGTSKGQNVRKSRAVVEIRTNGVDRSHGAVLDVDDEELPLPVMFDDESDEEENFLGSAVATTARERGPIPGLKRHARIADPVLLRAEIRKGTFAHLQVACAKSQNFGFQPPLPPKDEHAVVQDLLKIHNQRDMSTRLSESSGSRPDSSGMDAPFMEFELSDFTVYLPDNPNHAWEMRGLNHLATRTAHSSFLFDGILSIGDRRHYVQGIPFKICSIGNYGKENHEVGSDIWIQSNLNSQDEVCYRLGSPSTDYLRFHKGFLWLANLAKHFVDYCQEADGDITIWDFESKFSQWIKHTHAESPIFNKWYSELPGYDFRVTVTRNIAFLYKESVGVDADLSSLSIWRELLHSNIIPSQKIKEPMTVVTPYVYECFRETRFGHVLKAIEPTSTAESRDGLQSDRLKGGLPSLDQCRALTTEQCQMIQDYIDPRHQRKQRDWALEHQAELIRQYMTMRNFHAIEEAMKPNLVWSYKTYSQLYSDWGFPVKRIDREQTAINLYARVTGRGRSLAIRGASPQEAVATSVKASQHDSQSEAQHEHEALIQRKDFITSINCGDVLSVTKDEEGSAWKDEVSRWKAIDSSWLVYIQRIHVSDNSERSFDAIWLYRPCDTMCAKMKYPYPKELFLSDNCTCSQRIKENEVLEKVAVNWYGTSSSQEFFIRQTYLENERFVSIKEEHKTCEHLSAAKVPDLTSQYPIGQTILAAPQQRRKHSLEAYEVIGHIPPTPVDNAYYVVGRHLIRRADIDESGCQPNELVYSVKTETINITKINGICMVRFYTVDDVIDNNIPAPYSRSGTANAFYITSRLVERIGGPLLEPIHGDVPQSLKQGFDPTEARTKHKLRGLDLYCGGGNFGRGLEEGGAIHNEWAVDLNPCAIHTYRANLKNPTDTKLYFGSVNDLLLEALEGNPSKSELIPSPGDVEFISAGSPCQGFSTINSRKGNASGLRNQSMVASVAAYIDFFRPDYGLLENVMGMAQKGKGRDEDILAQLICAIVGMGYQVRCFLLDAWSFGSPQGRIRLFVSFAAPGLTPQAHPRLSHAHPMDITTRGLGMMANGQSFSHRVHCKTFFKMPTAGANTAGLPFLGDGATEHCTSHPDHVVSANQNQELWGQMSHIPKYPREMCLAKAWNEGKGILSSADRQKYWGHLIHNAEGKVRERFSSVSRAYGRIDPGRCFPTIMTVPDTKDSRTGLILHWDEDRTISLLEARRAQSFPDHEVLVGIPTECWKIVGNSVARTMSLALGLSLREAWLKNSGNPLPHRTAIGTSTVIGAATTKVILLSKGVAQGEKATLQPLQSRHGFLSSMDANAVGELRESLLPDHLSDPDSIKISSSQKRTESTPQSNPKLRERNSVAGLRRSAKSAGETSNLPMLKRAFKRLGSSLESSRISSTCSSEASCSSAGEASERDRSPIAKAAQDKSQTRSLHVNEQRPEVLGVQELSEDEDEINDAIFHQLMGKVRYSKPTGAMDTSSSENNPLKRQRSPVDPNPSHMLEKRQKLAGLDQICSMSRESSARGSATLQYMSSQRQFHDKGRVIQTPEKGYRRIPIMSLSYSQPRPKPNQRGKVEPTATQQSVVIDLTSDSEDELGSNKTPMMLDEMRKARFRAKMDRKNIRMG